VHQAEIAQVFEADGPFTSVYLDTEGDVEQAADRVALRWKNLDGSMLATATVEADNRALLDRFAEELGQAATGAERGDRAVEGAAATLAGLGALPRFPLGP
jgi:hypothetical protein